MTSTRDPSSEPVAHQEFLDDPAILGERLRELRRRSGVSLRALARQLGISASAVSQIERGAMQPSVNRLIAITDALGVSLAEVFETSAEKQAEDVASNTSTASYALARAGQISPVHLESGVVLRSLSPMPHSQVQFFESTYPAGANGSDHGEMNRHHGVEFGQVTEGELTIVFEDERVVLRPGDSITYPCTLPHHLRNESSSRTRATWLIVDL